MKRTSPILPVVVVCGLLGLGIANVSVRATWHGIEDGVLWTVQPEGVVATDIATRTPAADVGVRRGDVLLAIDDHPVQQLSDIAQLLHGAQAGQTVRYTILRLGTREVVDVRIAPIPTGPRTIYFVLAAVGIFTLLVGGAVRLRRPRDPATLHFFWLCVAFFGLFTFSFSGRLDRLDWVFYWADAISMLALPPLFLHFTLAFPERARRWTSGPIARLAIPMAYMPAVLLGVAHVIAVARASGDAGRFVTMLEALDRLEFLYLAGCLIAGLAALARALGEVRSITARRQLRWIAWGTALGGAPFAFGYALPFALGVDTSLPMQLSAIPLGLIPLAYASAIVRYRLMDVEVIVKRALVYAAALGAIVAIYAAMLQGVQRVWLRGDNEHNWIIAFLATLVALLLAPPVKSAVQNVLDRAFYRDRYDYRRALVGFARDLNSDLDLHRLSERLVSRVVETLLVDRMSLMLEDEVAPYYGSVRASGFGDSHPPALPKVSEIGARLADGHVVALDDPIASTRFSVEEIEFWRDAGLYYFVPCVSKEGAIAVLAVGRKDTGEPLNSEDMGLLAAVAGQIATALENARLYRQLHVKAVELDRVRAFNENILESLDDGLLVLDLNDRVVRWNPAMEALSGMPKGDATGRRLDDLFDAPFVEAIRAARRDSPHGTTLSRLQLGRRTRERRDGVPVDNKERREGVPVDNKERREGVPVDNKERREGVPVDSEQPLIVNAAVVPLRAADEGGVATVGTIVIIEDVTRRVQLEEQLQISEKMASIGLLAAGVAHEVNTPLTGISSFTQMLLEGADPEDPKTKVLEKIERQTFRAAKIVNGLLTLSRPGAAGATEVAPVDVNVVIGDVLSLLEHQFQLQRVTVRRELNEQPVMLVGAEQKLQQVFLNLFLNAKDAMPKGGWLSIATRAEHGNAIVEVSDTGSGIPSEYLARIYDPFFTTKAIGQGTGLGLSITYGIVREHDGSIDCESIIGQGTRFTLRFPLAPAARLARAAH